mmetsp:Transcript_114404/g.334468  ORF Transcript_114404/g.334468 Transcript_114404/m.334468 type:complete len:92 (+) Transcript_114404:156-431(+)
MIVLSPLCWLLGTCLFCLLRSCWAMLMPVETSEEASVGLDVRLLFGKSGQAVPERECHARCAAAGRLSMLEEAWSVASVCALIAADDSVGG